MLPLTLKLNIKKIILLSLILWILSGILAKGYPQENIRAYALRNRMLDIANVRKDVSKIRMKVSYTALFDTLDETGQRKLRMAQNDWEHFKVSECSFETDYARNDAIQALLYENCLSGMNNARSTYFNNILKWNYIVIPIYGLQPKENGNKKDTHFALF